MSKAIRKLLNSCHMLFYFQILSWGGAITGGSLLLLSLISIARDWLFYHANENLKLQVIFLLAGALSIVVSILVSRAFQSIIKKINRLVQRPIGIKPRNEDEWVARISKSIRLKRLENGVWFGRFSSRFIYNIYIIPEDGPEAVQPGFQEACILLAKKRLNIRFRGTKRELSHNLTLFISMLQTRNLDDNTRGVDIDYYPEGGFRMSTEIAFKEGIMRLPQISGKLGVFISHYSAGVKWLFENTK